MPLTDGQVLRERYRIDALLGQGGMGAVYRGTDLTFEHPVAIKENRMATPESQKQFTREARLLYRLRHPNLPRVIDHFFLRGQGQYLVMDYIEGEDLAEVVSAQGPIPQAQALDWIGQVLNAVDYLHSQGVIHRDVKPANVKIAPGGQVYLVDFGLAKVYDPLQQTTVGARGVTPGFAPPEQYGQGRTDARTDVYSVGATLYALVTGQRPPDALESVTGQASLVPPRRIQPALSPGLEAAIVRAMAIRPDDRFPTAAEFRTALLEPPTRAVSDLEERGAPPAPVAVLPSQREEAPPPSVSESEPGTRLAEAGRRQRLAELLPEAWAAFQSEDWATAAERAADALALEPGHGEATMLLQRARTAQQLARRYGEATGAMEAADWATAAQSLEEVLALDADYRDAAALLDRVREALARQERIAQLRARGQDALDGREWDQALASFEELQSLDPEDAEASEALERARQGLEADRRAEALYREAEGHVDAGSWAEAVATLEEALGLRPGIARYADLLETAQARQEAEARARLLAEAQARAEEERQKRLEDLYWRVERLIKSDPDRALTMVGELGREAPNFPGLRDLWQRAHEALREKQQQQAEQRALQAEAKQERRKKLQYRLVLAAAAVALLVVAIEIGRTISAAVTKSRMARAHEAAVAAFDRGQWDEGRAELDEIAVVDRESVPTDDLLRDGRLHGAEQAAAFGSWEVAAGFVTELSQMDMKDYAQDLNDLVAQYPPLRRALWEQHGTWFVGWHEEQASGLTFPTGGGELLSTGADAVRRWDIAGCAALTDGCGAALPMVQVEGELVTPAPDGTLAASVVDGDRLVLTGLPDGAPVGMLEVGRSVRALAFSPDGSILAVGTAFGPVQLWSTAPCADPSQACEAPLRELATDDARTLVFAPDGSLLSAASRRPQVQVWRVADGAPVQEFAVQGGTPGTVAFSPDGTVLATIEQDTYDVQLWQVSSGDLLRELDGLDGWVCSLAFSPDGQMIAAGEGSINGTVKVWGVSDGRLLHTLGGFPDYRVQAIAFSPDGRHLAAASALVTWHEDKNQVIEEHVLGLVQLWPLE